MREPSLEVGGDEEGKLRMVVEVERGRVVVLGDERMGIGEWELESGAPRSGETFSKEGW